MRSDLDKILGKSFNLKVTKRIVGGIYLEVNRSGLQKFVRNDSGKLSYDGLKISHDVVQLVEITEDRVFGNSYHYTILGSFADPKVAIEFKNAVLGEAAKDALKNAVLNR